MPSITPTDGNYSYYTKALKDLEEDLRADTKRAKQRLEDETRELKEAQKQELAERERDTEETINNIRKNANDTIARDREVSKSEVDRVKAQTYDKFGRYNGQEADALKGQFEELRRTAEEQHRKDKGALDLSESEYREKLEDQRKEQARAMEDAVRTTRDSIEETYASASKSQKEDYAAFRKEAEDKHTELIRRHNEDIQAERRKLDRALTEAKTGYERKLDKAEHSQESQLEKLEDSYAEKMYHGTRTTAESRAEESKLLHEQLNDVVQTESRRRKEKSTGTEEATRQFEDEWRSKLQTTAGDYERQIDRLKNQTKLDEEYYNKRNAESLREKETFYSDLIAKGSRDHQAERKEADDHFRRDITQKNEEIKRDRELSRKSTESQLASANAQQQNALKGQAKAFQDTLEQQRAAAQEREASLQKELGTKKTSSDTSLVSPGAEAAIRKSVINEYQKTLEAEKERNSNSVDSIQRDYAHRLTQTLQDKETSEASIHKQYQIDREIERGRLVSHIEDTEFMKNDALRTKEFENSKERENLTRNYSLVLERQRREYEDMLLAAKADAAYKLAAQRQEAEFNSKLAQREFSARQNELVRDYNKKLEDQKQDYDAKFDELKVQTQLQVKDADRKSRMALDEQKRAYEFRLAQAEQQHKERERLLTENYEEQLEKAKRSNALLITKKG